VTLADLVALDDIVVRHLFSGFFIDPFQPDTVSRFTVYLMKADFLAL
jgi:hypothetical protein